MSWEILRRCGSVNSFVRAGHPKLQKGLKSLPAGMPGAKRYWEGRTVGVHDRNSRNVTITFNMTSTITLSVASSLCMLVGLLNQFPAYYTGLADQRTQYSSKPYSTHYGLNLTRLLYNPCKTLANLFKATYISPRAAGADRQSCICTGRGPGEGVRHSFASCFSGNPGLLCT